jgi:xanthine dehydrogenase YagR molybdenum-binding subunit
MTVAWTRTDAVEKLTGAARFAADRPVDWHAVLVMSTIPAGRVVRIEATAGPAATAGPPGKAGRQQAPHADTTTNTAGAEGTSGTVHVITHENATRLHPLATGELAEGKVSVYVQRILPLQDDRVHYEGQPIAVVLAGNLEQAQEVAATLRVDYEPAPATLCADPATTRPALDWLVDAASSVGDLDAGVAQADVIVDREYTTSARHHSPIEPPATVAEWRDGELVLHDATQSLFAVRDTVAAVLSLPVASVRVVAQHVGGGFGSKGYVWPHLLIAAMAARMVGGSVKLGLSRAQTFTSNGHQPATRQQVLLAARADGRLTAIRHTSTNTTAEYAEYAEYAALGTRTMYACPAIETSTRVAPIGMNLPTPMRSPHEGPGMFALESAIDELSYELGMDPLELRLRNYADHDPTEGRPFSSKELRACYADGARRFGWQRRPPRPRSMRDGADLVGWGMASVILHTVRLPATARVAMDADGRLTVSAGTQELGGGTRTIMAQIAAEVLGIGPERVSVALGDTTLPANLYSVGSSTANSLGSAVRAAALTLQERLATSAPPITVEQTWFPERSGYSMHSFGAVFAEVRVDAELAVPRVRRLVGVYSAGRVINALTARSQLVGGLVWGVGQALLERSTVDTTLGRYVSKNLAGYLIPVNADIPELDVSFVDEYDPHASGLGGRGIGELAPIGVAAAIANAIYHATGVRVRSLPIGVEDLLAAPG